MKNQDPSDPKPTVRDLEIQEWLENREETPEDIFRRWALIILAVLAVALVAAAFCYRPFKRQRARAAAALAEIEIGNRKFPEARLTLRRAMALGMNEPPVLRALAHYSSELGLAEGLGYWEKLETSGAATAEDRQKMAESALQLGRVDVVERLAQSELGKGERNPATLRLLAQARLREQNPASAAAILREVISHNPASEADVVALNRILLWDTNKMTRLDARAILMGMALSHSAASADAAVSLAGESDLSRAEMRLLLGKFAEITNSDFVIRASAADLEIRLDPEAGPAVADRMLSRFDQYDELERVSVAAWTAYHEPKRWIAFFGVRPAKEPVLGELYAEAMADSGAWKDLEFYLSATTNGINEAEDLWLKARLALHAGKTDDAKLLLRDGIRAREASSRALYNLAKTSESLAFFPEAIGAWKALARNPTQVLRASQEILRIGVMTSDPASIRSALELLDDFMPQQPEIIGQRAIYDVLAGERVRPAVLVLQSLREKYPANTGWRDGLALALLKDGDASKAQEVMEGHDWDWAKATAQSRSIYVAVLGAVGQRQSARRLAREISKDTLSEPYRQLIEPWL